MWRWVLGVLAGMAALVTLAGVAFVWLVFAGEDGRFEGELVNGRAVQTTLAIRARGGPVDAVLLFIDTDLHLITDVQGAMEVPFSYYRPPIWKRMIWDGPCADTMGRVTVKLIYKTDPVPRMKVPQDDVFSCAVDETDISGLLARSRPAEEAVETGLTQAAWRAFDARVQAEPELVGMSYARNSETAPYDYTCSIAFPFVWQADDALAVPILEGIEAGLNSLSDHAADGQRRLHREVYDLARDADKDAADTYNAHREEEVARTSFATVQRGDKVARTRGLAIYQPGVLVRGSKADCEAFERFDLTPLWQDLRDEAALARAWDARKQAQDAGASLAWDALLSPVAVRGPMEQILYRYRYYRLKQ